MSIRRDAEQAAELMALVEVVLAEMPGWEVRVDGQRVDGDVRVFARRTIERACGVRIGDA